MILHNGIKYVLRGSSEDNGTYDHYYNTKEIRSTYNIRYDGQKGTLTKTYVVYIDEATGDIIQKDYFQWNLNYGYVSRSGVCYSAADEQEINSLIIEEDPIDTNHHDDNNQGGSGHNSGETDNSNNFKDHKFNFDEPEDPTHNSEEKNIETEKGLFDDTRGSTTEQYNRSQLPLGADIKNPDIIGADVYEWLGPTPRPNELASKGTAYPIIRINDHYFQQNEIIYFSMETGMTKNYYDYQLYQIPKSGFLPTMKLIINTSNPSMLKQDHVKQGDRCAVFFSSNHGMVKSMRCDFRITNVVTNTIDQNEISRYNTQIISGELYIPDLRNEEIRYNFNGSSRDALLDIAKRLRLSFFFCDPDDTDDVMVWCNCKTPEMFIHDLTTHAWKNPDAFFESWIDPRYGLSFQNINRLLGETGYDEPIDVTLWINTLLNNRSADGKAAEKSAAEKIKTDQPQAKILTNIPSDKESSTVYKVNSWRLINNAQEIQDFIGLNCKQQYSSVNPGLRDDDNTNKIVSYSVDFSLCLNRTKFDPQKAANPKTAADNNFYVLLGPARNKTYANADDMMNQNETLSSNKVEPEQITNQQSDGDAEQLLALDNNMLSSGNTHKFYEVAYEHNMRNLLQLQKQLIQVELNGANLTIVRGEKIPMMLMDLNKVDSAYRSNTSKTVVQDLLYEAESGWFIIDGIEWIYDPSQDNSGTYFRTKLNLTRREWPIPGKDNTVNPNNGEISDYSKKLVWVQTGQGDIKMAYKDALYQYGKNNILGSVVNLEDENGNILNEFTVTASAPQKPGMGDAAEDQQGETGVVYLANGKTYKMNVNTASLDLIDQVVLKKDKVENSPIPLTGLKDFMKDIYRAIVQESDNKVKLVSARRWAVDEYGNKVDGNAFVMKNGYYKCMNAIGDVMYFKSNNSRHLYGEAIDIINNGIEFTELMTNIIMKRPSILQLMYDNGVSAYIEQAKDDSGVTTKHYHIGTDTIKQKEFWASVKALTGTDRIPGSLNTFTNYMKNNNKASVEITRENINELSNNE